MDERDVDARFASIVSAWDGPLPTGTEDLEGDGPLEAPPDVDADGAARQPDTEPTPPGSEAGRPPWVNPSPLDLVVPPSVWRGPTTPDAGAATGVGEGGAAGAGAAASTDSDDEHFEPPPVTLPPQEDLHFWGAVIGLVAGPLILLWVALARPFYTGRWFAAGVVLSLVGFGLLVLRQPRHRDPTDGDDGARV
jgi:hypothetical protein